MLEVVFEVTKIKQNHEIFCSFPVREMRPTCDDHNFSKSRSWIASFGTFAGLGLGIQGFFSQIDRLRCAGRIRKNDFVYCSLLFFVGGEILEVLDYSARAARRCGLSKNACF